VNIHYKISFFLLLYSYNLFAQNCETDRYTNSIFDSSQSFTNVTYAKNVPEFQLSIFGSESVEDIDLSMDIRLPPSTDTATKRPAIVWAHSGGFILGSKANNDMQALIDTFARRGYVTASIQYRMGMNILDDVSAERAVYRATQDASAAVRFFRENADILKIDPDLIFVAGSSAGSVAALHLGYVENSERPASSFEQTNGSGSVIAEDLGNLHSHSIEQITNGSLSNPVSTTVSGNESGMPNGILACWGGLGDLDWINVQTDTPPIILFHGLDDTVVYPDCEQPFQGLGTMPILCGSEEIDIKMTAVGIDHETHLYAGEGHEFWGASNGDFGADSQPDNPTLWQEAIDKMSDFLYDFIPQATTPDFNGLTTLCPNTSTNYTTTDLPNASYCWEVTGGTINNDDGSSIEVLWGEEGMGSISLQVANEHGMVGNVDELLVNIAPLRVQVKVFLEGSSNTSLKDNNLFLFQQPYNQAPWFYSGNESTSLSEIPSNAVDWVLVEARNPNNKFEVLDRAAGLLLTNGNIVSADEPTQGLMMCNLEHGQDYHLVVRHRNHLDVMSRTAIALPNTVPYDFTSAVNQAEGAGQLVNINGLGFAMILGDVNGDGVMSLLDFNALIGQISLLNQYQSADFNFDGHVLVEDFNRYQKNASAIGVEEVRY